MPHNNNILQNIAVITAAQKDAINLLKTLISIPSFSKEEDRTAVILNSFLLERNVKTQRVKNNIWATNLYFDAAKPTILLNSHHDTVKPNKEYTREPFSPFEHDGKFWCS
jgi:acetylornithine deacetylase